MKTISLNGVWQGCGISPEGEELYFTGEVPGCVHTDLLREGRIDDPFFARQSEDCRWIERWGWYYERTFTLSEVAPGTEIRFDGLDTICEVYLNGKRIGSADDMFLSYRFPAKGAVVGENTIRVVFSSPVCYMAGRPKLNAAFTAERLYTRRIQCTYGWDWVDRFVTCGIFRDCAVVIPDEAEIGSVYVYTKSVDAESAQIGLQLRVVLHGEGVWAYCRIVSPDGKPVYEKCRWVEESYLCEKIDLKSPRLWYPNGCGEAALYTLTVRLSADREGNEPLDAYSCPFGIRTVKLLELPDEPGSETEAECRRLRRRPVVGRRRRVRPQRELFGLYRYGERDPRLLQGRQLGPLRAVSLGRNGR